MNYQLVNSHPPHKMKIKLEMLNSGSILQGDRKVSVLLSIAFAFMLYVMCIYWWHCNDDLLSPLAMVPPKATPPFWHTIFIVLVNGMDLFCVCTKCSNYIVRNCLSQAIFLLYHSDIKCMLIVCHLNRILAA